MFDLHLNLFKFYKFKCEKDNNYALKISEGGQHVGARGGLRQFDFEKNVESNSMQYVGLITPPRTLTLEESFPTVEQQRDYEEAEVTVNKSQLAKRPNGYKLS